MSKLSVEQAAYLAGAIDGEGSFGLVPHKRTANASLAFQARITIGNVRGDWLETIQAWVGSGWMEKRQGKFNKRPCYQLRWVGSAAQEVLSAVLPYLMIKREQGQLFVRYFELAARRKATNARGQRSDPAVVQAMAALHFDLKVLNQRGVIAVQTPPSTPIVRLCSIDGCGQRRYSNGYCRKHYRRYIEHGGFKLYEKQCVICNRTFTARRKDTKCCSKPCGDRHQFVSNRERHNAYKRAWRARQKLEQPQET